MIRGEEKEPEQKELDPTELAVFVPDEEEDEELPELEELEPREFRLSAPEASRGVRSTTRATGGANLEEEMQIFKKNFAQYQRPTEEMLDDVNFVDTLFIVREMYDLSEEQKEMVDKLYYENEWRYGPGPNDKLSINRAEEILMDNPVALYRLVNDIISEIVEDIHVYYKKSAMELFSGIIELQGINFAFDEEEIENIQKLIENVAEQEEFPVD